MISDLGKIVGKYEIKWILALLTQAALNTALLTGFSSQAWAQETILQGSPARDGGDLCDAFDPLPCIRRVGQDEVGLTRSLFHPTRRSLSAILGVTAATGVALHFDKQMSKTLMGLPGNPTQINRAADITGVYAPFAAGGLMYLTGSFLHNSHARETGMLATEAMVDGALIGQGLKFVVNRQSPGTAPQAGDFYASGVPRGGSMPSAHAINAWAFARVVAGESHSKWVGAVAYGLATTISFSRTLTGAHSVSDVIVGSAIGFGIGEYVLHRRGREWRNAVSKDPSMLPTRKDSDKSSGIVKSTFAPTAGTSTLASGVPVVDMKSNWNSSPALLEDAIPLVSEVEYPDTT